jgi:rRNA maturation protein Nop10
MSKLKYFLKNNKKIYTLKEEVPETKEKTKDAHYKFIRIKTESSD